MERLIQHNECFFFDFAMHDAKCGNEWELTYTDLNGKMSPCNHHKYTNSFQKYIQ